MSCTLEILVTPKSKKQRCILTDSKQLKCYLVQPPEKGKANQELIDLLAKTIGIKKQAINIINGLTSRKKTVAIETSYSREELLLLLVPHQQTSLLS